jgi:tetratricopeptide (TPR) repeat protein
MGAVHISLNDPYTTLTCLNEAQDIFRECGDCEGFEACVSNRVLVMLGFGDQAGAFEMRCAQEARLREAGNKRRLSLCLATQAAILRQEGKDAEAMAKSSESEALCRKTADTGGQSVALDVKSQDWQARSGGSCGVTTEPDLLSDCVRQRANGPKLRTRRKWCVMMKPNQPKVLVRVEDPICPSFGKGINFYQNRLFADAIACFDQALKELSGSGDNFRLRGAWKWKGRAYGELQRHEDELHCYERGIEIDSNDFDLWFGKADALDDLGRLEEAVLCYDRALALDKKSYRAWYDRGLVLRKLDRHEEALLSFSYALTIDPKSASAWLAKGAELGALGRYAEEVACYDSALAIDATDPKLWDNRGQALGSMGQMAEAIACFDRAIKLAPRFAEAWFNKGATLWNSGQARDALGCFEEARLLGSAKAGEIAEQIRQRIR